MTDPYVKVGAPSWYCETCESWWPGGWGPVYIGDPPTPEQQQQDLETYHYLTNRTCAECGRQLIPRLRTIALVEVRHYDDDGTT